MLDTQIASLTGILPGGVTSTGPDIFLNLVSDYSETKPGFRIEYDSGKIDEFLWFFIYYKGFNPTQPNLLYWSAHISLIAVVPVVSPCGDFKPLVVDHEITGEVLSPNYPSPYPNNADCQWHIIVDSGFVVQLTFLEFNITE